MDLSDFETASKEALALMGEQDSLDGETIVRRLILVHLEYGRSVYKVRKLGDGSLVATPLSGGDLEEREDYDEIHSYMYYEES